MIPKYRSSIRPWIGVVIFTILAGLTAFMSGQQRGQMADPQNGMHVPVLTFGPQQDSVELPGLPDDWSFHHVVFTDPGTEEDAIRAGKQEEWLRVVNDPRYMIQQAKRARWAGAAATSGLTPEMLVLLPDISGVHRGMPTPVPARHRLTRDWQEPLPYTTMPAGQFPAKYSFTGAASCSDYVIYPTGVNSTSNATIIAYTNLYPGTGAGECGASAPTTYWAYYTPVSGSGGTAVLSPVIDGAGDQVAFVETIGSTAYLVLLHMTNSGSLVTAPSSVSASSYQGCTAPCYTTFSLSTTDSDSPPFYYYAHDTIYVGDDGGNVHQFTTAFTGTPTAGFTTKVTGSETSTHLTGPVVDPNSGLIFVGDNSGYLHSINSTGGSLQTSNQTDTSSYGLVDAPLIDSTGSTSYAYVFINNVTTQHAMYVNQFNTSTSINATWGTYLQITGYSTSSPLYAGAFDNQHTTASNGNLYFCGSYSTNGSNSIPTLYQIEMNSTFSNSSYITYNTPASGAATCSPVTEFYNGSTDYLYLGVTANGNATGICTGACLYSYSIPSSGSGTAGSILGGLSVAGGASGTIIDNNSTTPTDASNIYFFSLSQEACPTSTTGCAVQASQANP